MDFANHTPYPAKFLTGSTGEQEILAVVACKATYRLIDGRLTAVTGKDAWPVFDKPYVFEGVTFPPELEFRKQGIDILVFGNAMAPRGEAVPWLRVAVESGRLCHQVAVFGDRVWEKGLFRVSMSDPVPFVEMPLMNDRAYGGKTTMAGAEVEHAVNPDGRGFLFEKAAVDGTPLPNLEDPDELIASWKDKPRPACFFKPRGVLERKGLPAEPPERMPFRVMPSLFNVAVPELIVEPEALGKELRLVGFAPEGDVVFPMPALRGPAVHVRVGELKSRFPLHLSTLVALPRAGVLVATYTALFRYLMRPMEKRSAELREDAGGSARSAAPVPRSAREAEGGTHVAR